MTAPLRVDPSALQAAASGVSGVASAVAALDVGGAVGGAADGVANLSSGAACRFAAESLSTDVQAVHDGLSTYASNLTAAARAYQDADERLGGRLDQAL
jgi:uncharacterized protein YukE